MQGNNVGSLNYSGSKLNNENAGINKKGRSAKSNLIGRLIGGVDDKDKQMALINGLLSEDIGRNALTKFAGDKLKLEQDEKKAKELYGDKAHTYLDGTTYEELLKASQIPDLFSNIDINKINPAFDCSCTN